MKTPSSLITLGTSAGPSLTPGRAQTSHLLTVNDTYYVVDAGDGAARRMARAGAEVRDVGIIFLTHHHDDHTAGLGTLMSLAWDRQRTDPINVYGPPRTKELVDAIVQYCSISADIRIADGGRSIPLDNMFFGHDVGIGEIFQDDNIRVTATENTHFSFHQGDAAGRFKSYSYRFETPDRVIAFTGDTGFSPAVTDLVKGADVLVTETSSCDDRKNRMMDDGIWQAMGTAEREGIMRQATMGHMGLDNIGKLATDAGVRKVVLSHLTRRFKSTDYEPWAEEVRNHYSGDVVIAEDLMEF
ncbi:MAG: MBL fold metallo-hydrolase [Alphaproteobacteria bacterium]|nr:MBL fold metallo-hydrolase [Alphaproteobacteria bacterium]